MSAVNTLVGMMTRYSSHESQFIEARELAKSIFTHQVPEGIQIISTETSYYVDHGINHVERVIVKIEALNGFLLAPLNRKEAFIILLAAYYHDMGMFIGRRQGEDPEQARNEHHTRSAEAIQMLNYRNFLHIPQEELEVIKKVIEAHRLTDLKELPESQWIEGFEIRTQLLGALLRIADSCDCDRSRASRAIFDLFYENIPDNSKEYWKMLFPVTDVRFEGRRTSIIVSINFAGNLKERIEKYRIGNLLKRKIDEELSSVEAVFRHNRVPLVRVEIEDFDSGRLIDFSSLPMYENIATVTLCSKFGRVDDLIDIVTHFISSTSDGIPLVIEFRPPEGPLFVDTEVHICTGKIEEMKSALQERLGPDLWGLRGEVIEKITLRRGIVS